MQNIRALPKQQMMDPWSIQANRPVVRFMDHDKKKLNNFNNNNNNSSNNQQQRQQIISPKHVLWAFPLSSTAFERVEDRKKSTTRPAGCKIAGSLQSNHVTTHCCARKQPNSYIFRRAYYIPTLPPPLPLCSTQGGCHVTVSEVIQKKTRNYSTRIWRVQARPSSPLRI